MKVVFDAVTRSASDAGMSLQNNLLAKLSEDAARPTLDEVPDRASGRAGGHVSLDTAVAAIRADRDDRDGSSSMRA